MNKGYKITRTFGKHVVQIGVLYFLTFLLLFKAFYSFWNQYCEVKGLTELFMQSQIYGLYSKIFLNWLSLTSSTDIQYASPNVLSDRCTKFERKSFTSSDSSVSSL